MEPLAHRMGVTHNIHHTGLAMNSQIRRSELDAAVSDFAEAMQSRYGMTIEDFGVGEDEIRQHLADALSQGETPADVVEWYGRKYDLTPVAGLDF